MKRSLFYLVFILLIGSCTNQKKPDATTSADPEKTTQLPVMKIDRSGESVGGEITMHIQKAEKLSDEITRFRILSDYKSQPVGFDLIIKRLAKRKLFVGDGITFRSLGDTSDHFLNALAEIYGLPQSPRSFTDSLTITYADLAAEMDMSQPGNMVAAQMKMFFSTDEDEAELFLNIDEQAGTISLPEKDPDYREGVIKALSKKTKK